MTPRRSWSSSRTSWRRWGSRRSSSRSRPARWIRVRAAKPDIIILDLIFGGRELAGWQLLQKIRMDRELERVPVILCSAAVRDVAEQQGYLTEQGVLIVLKPFTVTQLEEALVRAVQMADEKTAPPSAAGDEA
jgi:CheY-like chemotaxis protein